VPSEIEMYVVIFVIWIVTGIIWKMEAKLKGV
jgi:hypothetical protein